MIVQANPSLIDAYFADTIHASQSVLKRMLVGMDIFNGDKSEKELYYEEKGHFIIGSGVDTWLTISKGAYKDSHYVSNIPKPTGKTMSIINRVYDSVILTLGDTTDVVPLNNFNEQILAGCIAEEYHTNWGDTARINAITRDGEPYFNDLIKSRNKQVLSPDENIIITNIVTSLKENPLTRMFFTRKYQPKKVDIHYQVPIYFTYRGIPCKALLDMLAIDHINKVVRIIDLKTTGTYTIFFPSSIRKFRYDIQAAFYTEALKNAISASISGAKGSPFFKKLIGYTIAPFTFMVESTKKQGNPLMFRVDDSLLQIGKHGRPDIRLKSMDSDDYIYYRPLYGFEEALRLMIFHTTHGFEKDEDVIMSGGVFNVNWDGKYMD